MGGGRGEEGAPAEVRAVSRAELERVLAAGAQARAWKAEVVRLRAKVVRARWAVVQERRRRELVEEEQEGAEARAVAAEERAAEAEERALRYYNSAVEWAGAHRMELEKRRAAEEEVARLREAAVGAAATAGPILVD